MTFKHDNNFGTEGVVPIQQRHATIFSYMISFSQIIYMIQVRTVWSFAEDAETKLGPARGTPDHSK